jgi:hypothetical protein
MHHAKLYSKNKLIIFSGLIEPVYYLSIDEILGKFLCNSRQKNADLVIQIEAF